MRVVALLSFLLCSAHALADPQPAPASAFAQALAGKVSALEKNNAAVATGTGDWLFLTNELRFLAQGPFWGAQAAQTSRARKPEAADPLAAILDFHRQLRERGIDLILVPVPPKAAIYPEKLGLDASVTPQDSAPALQEFYGVLRERGIDVLDLTEVLVRNRESPRGLAYCRTDSHWSGIGCALAGEAIAQQIRTKMPSLPAGQEFARAWKEVSITGDLAALVGQGKKISPETIAVRQVAANVQPDPNSPVLLLGDSHTLVFHDFLAERAGLLDQLTAELGFAPDLIGTRGSGATPVRISLYRRSRSDPQFLAKKKIVVWCFAAREFTEADQGWVVQPIAR